MKSNCIENKGNANKLSIKGKLFLETCKSIMKWIKINKRTNDATFYLTYPLLQEKTGLDSTSKRSNSLSNYENK